MTISLEQISPAGVTYDADDPMLAHDAAELRAHLRPGGQADCAVTFLVAPGAVADDGFELRVSSPHIGIIGGNARGVLNGVYALLEFG